MQRYLQTDPDVSGTAPEAAGRDPYSQRTVYRVMKQIGLSHRPKRKPNGLTKADREAMKSDDLLKRDFHADAPLEKCVTDITEIKASNGKLYISALQFLTALILVS